MTEEQQNQLGNMLWKIADKLRGAMNADDFRDYMLSFLFLRHLSDNYEQEAKKELGEDYPAINGHTTPLQRWYEENPNDVALFEGTMRRNIHYVVQPDYLWDNIASLARRQHGDLLETLQKGFNHIEEKSFKTTFQGLFSEINLNSEKLGKRHEDRNARLCAIVAEIAEGIAEFSSDRDTLGDAYEYLLDKFAAGGGKKAGEFYTPRQISTILARIVTLDGQDPRAGQKRNLESVFDFACGSGSLLLSVRKRFDDGCGVGRIYGQESNITTHNLARMNMLLHGVRDSEFEIFHGDTLKNDWDMLREENPAKKRRFDAVVANPPFSLRWDPAEALADDVRFKNYGVAPRSAADFAFLLHGLHYLKDDGVMAIVMPHGVLFRGGVERRIRVKLLDDGNIDTVIGLPANLFYSTGIPVCVLVLKKCKRHDDVLFVNASEHFEKGKRQNNLRPEDVEKIVSAYRERTEEDRYARRVPMTEIVEKHDHNLNISRYVGTAKPEKEVDLRAVHRKLRGLETDIESALDKHNGFLKELGLPALFEGKGKKDDRI